MLGLGLLIAPPIMLRSSLVFNISLDGLGLELNAPWVGLCRPIAGLVVLFMFS